MNDGLGIITIPLFEWIEAQTFTVDRFSINLWIFTSGKIVNEFR